MPDIIAAVVGFILAALIFITMYAISWGMCFGFSISLATATGVWLALCLVKYILSELRSKGQ